MRADAARTGARRIVVLIDLLLGGGAERVAVELAGGLDRERFVPELVVTRHTGPLEPLARSRGLQPTILGRNWGFSPRKLARAVRVARSCDLVHAHKFAGGCWGVLIARLALKPVIVHEHSAYGGRRTLVRTMLYRYWIGRRARAVLCVSDDVAASLIAEGVDPALVEVVSNGVTVSATLDRATARRELGLEPNGLVVGIVGRLRAEKRHDLLLRAVSTLRASGYSLQLCVVGDGPLRAELETLGSSLGIANIVVWTGERDHAARLAAAFDVAVLCSDFEGLPLAALEALAAGVPVVATAVGALPQLLAGGAGVVVPCNDVQALAEAVARLLDDVGLRSEAGERGRELVRRQFSLERAVLDVERVYDRVLDSDPRRRSSVVRS